MLRQSLILVYLALVCSTILSLSNGDSFNVLDHGAIGDGKADDTQAFESAWGSTCMSAYNPTMEIPSNHTFLLNSINFKGPCNSTNVHVEMNGDIVGLRDPSAWACGAGKRCRKWIQFKEVNGLTIKGSGTIDGRGRLWWSLTDIGSKPSALEIRDSNYVVLSGIRLKNNPQVHVVFAGSSFIDISSVTIKSPERSPNTDGLHFKEASHVSIHNCQIQTGDDCISIVDGSSYFNISNIACGPGHGISIGSLGKGGSVGAVEYINVTDVQFKGTTNGARIKTWQGGKGYARHIRFENITSSNSDNPIIIDQFYCDRQQCESQDSAVRVSNITFSDFRGTSRGRTAVKLACSDAVACEDIFVNNINLRASNGQNASSYCNNVYGTARGDIHPIIPCLI